MGQKEKDILKESFKKSYGREPTKKELETFEEYLKLIGRLPDIER
jgi:phosphoribosylformylglycinamidine (FGAM) synthase-like enzyme